MLIKGKIIQTQRLWGVEVAASKNKAGLVQCYYCSFTVGSRWVCVAVTANKSYLGVKNLLGPLTAPTVAPPTLTAPRLEGEWAQQSGPPLGPPPTHVTPQSPPQLCQKEKFLGSGLAVSGRHVDLVRPTHRTAVHSPAPRRHVMAQLSGPRPAG